MAESLTTFSDPRTEMSVLETNQYLCSQLEKNKQNFRDLTEKFLTSKATAYILANQLQKYKSEEYKGLIESVLEEEVQFDRQLAEKMRPAARLGKYDPLIQAQAQELTHLRQRIQEGKGVCYLFIQHTKSTVKSFEGLLRSTDIARYQGQRFCEQLAQGSQLAENLASKLTTENYNDRKDEDGQEPLAPRLCRELQEEEENEVSEDSLDERYLTHSSHCDSHQPPSSSAFPSDVQEASSVAEVTKDEIQSLHRHLKEIIFINDCLQEKLQHHLSISDQGNGCTSNLNRQSLESIAQLYNEKRGIREESLSLLAHLNRISRGPQTPGSRKEYFWEIHPSGTNHSSRMQA
ncbi:neuroblastoma breakpoint family member 6-like protein isoform X1 [Leptonychotes weddellii]|uniref:Neuroblastoma breakpoint family member 6-like protein isoform X1 n=1 Tax=Leptonychotes weddellii TaxID=9713 RepID=A0A7F8Q0H8_LEPWE|nr:neuroblastoma breakpoint family member 6-like protein isoform X1 [Leptonychotes weddellii]